MAPLVFRKNGHTWVKLLLIAQNMSYVIGLWHPLSLREIIDRVNIKNTFDLNQGERGVTCDHKGGK